MVQQTILSEAFEIVRMLSRGGTSEVLEARDRGRRRVAIKLLNASLTRDPELVARFKREARAASSLVSQHVVRVLDIGTTETKRPFLVMEFLVGRDLGTELAVRGSIPLPEAASYLSHAARR